MFDLGYDNEIAMSSLFCVYFPQLVKG
uniref:Uncharacterized protein n=1 Tax=Rhizophora mucronata TaxID=61149 RepID=A0A2P2Q1N8_RHIMU